MIYTNLPNRTAQNLNQMYSPGSTKKRVTKHYEYVVVHRKGKIFQQLREINDHGKSEMEEIEMDIPDIIEDIGKMSKEDWCRKHNPAFYDNYKKRAEECKNGYRGTMELRLITTFGKR